MKVILVDIKYLCVNEFKYEVKSKMCNNNEHIYYPLIIILFYNIKFLNQSLEIG